MPYRKITAGILLAAVVVAGVVWLSRSGDERPADRPQEVASRRTGEVTPVHVAAVRAGQPSADEVRTDGGHPFEFRRLILDTAGDMPEACFRFSRPLDARAEVHYGDYLKIEPPVAAAVRTANTDLCLSGLSYGTDYKVTLATGLPAQTGDRTGRAEAVAVSLGDRPPLVSLAGEGFILPRDTANGLAVKTVNVDRVKIHVLRMSDRLLTAQIRSSDDYVLNAVLRRSLTSRYGLRKLLTDQTSVVWSGELSILADHNRSVDTAFPLSTVIKNGAVGAYLVVAEQSAKALPDKFWAGAGGAADEDEEYGQGWIDNIPIHWVVVTDIALTTVSGADGLHVFARSLATAEPLPGIKLALIAAGQDLLGEAVTDAAGQVGFAPGLVRGKGAAAAAAITAYGGRGDFAMLDLTRAAFDLSDRGVSGRQSPGAADAFLYTERGIYRPGETVELMALLRDRVGAALSDRPLTLVLRRPDGVEAKRFALSPAAQAGFHQPIPLSRTAARGLWSAEALVDPAGQPVGRVQFDVQDFVPQRLKVTLTAAASFLRPNGRIEATVDGQFLYGAPAAGLNGEATLAILRDPSPAPDAKGYSFGLVDEKVAEALQSLDLPTADDAGHIVLADVLKPPVASSAPLKGVLSVGLFEPSGRLVKDEVTFAIRTQPLLIGLKPRFTDYRAEEDKDAVVDIRVFDESGHPIARPGLHWSLVRENRVYDWFELDGSWRWHYHTVDEPVASGSVDVPAGAPAALSQPVQWGQYRLVVDDAATKAATSIRFNAGWTRGENAAETPDKLDVTLEKPAYDAGETARVRIQGPFAGKAQLVVAGDRVFETRVFDLPAQGATLDIKASSEWGSGAYAIVSLYRPLTAARPRDPVRAVGVAWMPIDAASRTLSVAIGAPEKVLPRHVVEIPLKVEGAVAGEPIQVTLAAVDEGILQLTRFPTPDPAGYFFGKRRLGVDIRDDYGRLLDGSADPGAIREGGDAGIGGPGLDVTSTRTVALFSGPVAVDRDGTTRVTLDIPDFEGQLRLMAVAYGHAAAGRGEGRLFVRDPVIADLSLPRFLAPGDRARLALLLHNTDGVAGTYHLDIAAAGAARTTADHPLDYPLAVGERKLDAVTIEALDEGVSTIAADLSGPGGYKVHREWQIAIRAPHYPIAIEDTARQMPGESFTLDAHQLDAFVPGSVSVSVGYSAFAGIDVASLLQSLYRYPYGCTEQLVSTASPLLYFDDPVRLGRAPKDEGVKARVARAIDTVLDRQDAAGKFGLWHANDGLAPVWLNVYALDFLLRARDGGFEVPAAALQRSFAWLTQAVRQLDQENAGKLFEGPHATRAYALYVMARSGRVDPGQLRYAHDTIDGTRLASGGFAPASVWWRPDRRRDSLAQSMSLGQLGGALHLMGDRARAHDAFEMAIANLGIRDFPGWWFHYSYYTEVQDTAALLAVAAEVGDKEVIERARERLVSLRPSSETMNTQEKAWILAAAHALNRDQGARSLTVDGRRLQNLKLPTAFAPSVDGVRQGFAVVNSSERDLWRTVVVHGAPKVAPSAAAAGYTISKEYFALDGTPIDPSHLRQNDRLIVSLSGANDDLEPHQTVVADLLPAGREIEAPVVRHGPVTVRGRGRRQSTTAAAARAEGPSPATPGFDFLGPLSTPRMIEARDDRFVAAFDLGRDRSRWNNPYFVDDEAARLEDNEFHLAYIVRVVTPGTFALPEAVVEDMYRPGMMGRTAAGDTTADPR
jgi:alpha-2-macroglobulin